MDFDEGLFEIEDQSLANALLDRVNEFNSSTGLKAFAVAAIFGSLPQAISSPLAFYGALCATLYFAEGKLPRGV